MGILKGDYFLCIESVYMKDDNEKVYTVGNTYMSEQNGCITNDLNDIGHEWNGVEEFDNYFTKIDVMKQGVKNDDDKLPYYTVLFEQFPNAIREVVKCSLAGHNKYKDTDKDWQNFRRLSNSERRYKNAMFRHMTESGVIEDMEPYGEMTHEAAVVWNALADLEIKLNKDK